MWRVVAGTVCVVVPVTVTVLDMFGYVAKVEGASMQPALNPANSRGVDYVLLNRWKAREYKFHKGEVVSLSYINNLKRELQRLGSSSPQKDKPKRELISPSDPDQKIIKRIIALEGDTVKSLSYKNRYVRIPEGHCWVEGDHHGQSLDSNFFGPVAQGLINAKATHIVWPPSRWQRMETVNIPEERLTKPPRIPTQFCDDLDSLGCDT